LSSLVTTLTETLRYRGAIGQWSWVLHRLTGLGVVLFLYLHVIDTSWSFFYPGLYEKAIAIYQTPLFTIGEFGLVFAVVYHAYNGLRIALFDYKPNWWKYQQRAAFVVLGLTLLTLIPTFVLMFAHVVEHYSHDPFILPLNQVFIEQLPFVAGLVVAVIAAVLFSGLAGLVTGSNRAIDPAVVNRGRGSRMERFWWSYMRVSGLLIVPLVFGHLALAHVIQGVFDLTTAGMPVAGVALNPEVTTVLGDGINNTGTAVEYVGERWNFLLGSVAIWRLYDIALLFLVTIHGFNGLRYVLTDYTAGSPLLRRAAVYLCVIGAVVLLVLGAGAMIGTIDETAVNLALESACELGRQLPGCPEVVSVLP
jgi:succinate dehydrogenase / fumarate reductase, cytochrome b subunit